MSEIQENKKLISLLSRIADENKLNALLTNLKAENEGMVNQIRMPKKISALEARQNRYDMIAKKFRDKYQFRKKY